MSKTKKSVFSNFSYEVTKGVNPKYVDVKCGFNYKGKPGEHFLVYVKQGKKPNSFYTDKAKADIKNLVKSGKLEKIANKNGSTGGKKPRGSKKGLIIGLSTAGALLVAAAVVTTTVYLTSLDTSSTTQKIDKAIDDALVTPTDLTPVASITASLVATQAKEQMESNLVQTVSNYAYVSDDTNLYPYSYVNYATVEKTHEAITSTAYNNLVQTIDTDVYEETVNQGISSKSTAKRVDTLFMKEKQGYQLYDNIKFSYDGYKGRELKVSRNLYGYTDPNSESNDIDTYMGVSRAEAERDMRAIFIRSEKFKLGADNDSTDTQYMFMNKNKDNAYIEVTETSDYRSVISPIDPSKSAVFRTTSRYVVHFVKENDYWYVDTYAVEENVVAYNNYIGEKLDTPVNVGSLRYTTKAVYGNPNSDKFVFGDYTALDFDSTVSPDIVRLNSLYYNCGDNDRTLIEPDNFQDVSLVYKALDDSFNGFAYSPNNGPQVNSMSMPAEDSYMGGRINEGFNPYNPVEWIESIYNSSYLKKTSSYSKNQPYVYLDKHYSYFFSIEDTSKSIIDYQVRGYDYVDTSAPDPYKLIEKDPANDGFHVRKSGYYSISLFRDENKKKENDKIYIAFINDYDVATNRTGYIYNNFNVKSTHGSTAAEAVVFTTEAEREEPRVLDENHEHHIHAKSGDVPNEGINVIHIDPATGTAPEQNHYFVPTKDVVIKDLDAGDVLDPSLYVIEQPSYNDGGGNPSYFGARFALKSPFKADQKTHTITQLYDWGKNIEIQAKAEPVKHRLSLVASNYSDYTIDAPKYDRAYDTPQNAIKTFDWTKPHTFTLYEKGNLCGSDKLPVDDLKGLFSVMYEGSLSNFVNNLKDNQGFSNDFDIKVSWTNNYGEFSIEVVVGSDEDKTKFENFIGDGAPWPDSHPIDITFGEDSRK